MKKHNYKIKVEWTGNRGDGTQNYKSYTRNHNILAENKYEAIKGSADPCFLGDKTKYNPEDLFLSSISACHMLCYLHLCSVNNIIVTDYFDNATAVMEETKDGKGKFTEVALHPNVKIKDSSKIKEANKLHQEANRMCFIANSCNFPIKHNPITTEE